jgi:hypothetical protein
MSGNQTVLVRPNEKTTPNRYRRAADSNIGSGAATLVLIHEMGGTIESWDLWEAEKRCRELYRERAIQRARAVERDPKAALN